MGKDNENPSNSKNTNEEELLSELNEVTKNSNSQLSSNKPETYMITENQGSDKGDDSGKDNFIDDKEVPTPKSNGADQTIQFIIIVLVIVLIIVTLGWFFSKLNTTNENDTSESEDELGSKKQRLEDYDKIIAVLNQKKEKIQKEEKRYLIAARLVIASAMVVVNIWFAHTYIYFDNTFELNKILNFNSAILLCYSFFGFITYGTPSNLVAALKTMISNYLKRKHVDTLGELERLIKDRETLQKEIEVFEK